MSAEDHDEPRGVAAIDAVQWHDGMLLSPQHFQIEAQRIEALVSAQLRTAVPFFWGVLALELDRSALLAGLFRVTALEAVMGDGLVLSLDRRDALELDLKALDRDLAAAPAAIHLAVGARRNVSADGALRRYRSVEGPAVADETTGDNPLPVPRQRPAPTLLATAGPLEAPGGGWVSLPLAVVARTDGRLDLLDYAPPLLRATQGSRPHALATEVALALCERCAALADRLRGAVEAGGESAGIAAALRAVSAPLPRLEAVLRDETAAPYGLYLTLCDVLGAVAGVVPALAPPLPPPYRHADSLPAFRALADTILPALATLRAGRRLVPLDRRADGSFVLTAEAPPLSDPFHLLLRPAPGVGQAATCDWAESAAIATEDAMAQLRLMRVRGAVRRLLDSAGLLDAAAPPHAIAVEVGRDPASITAGQRLEIRHPGGAEAPGAPAGIALVLPPAEPDP